MWENFLNKRKEFNILRRCIIIELLWNGMKRVRFLAGNYVFARQEQSEILLREQKKKMFLNLFQVFCFSHFPHPSNHFHKINLLFFPIHPFSSHNFLSHSFRTDSSFFYNGERLFPLLENFATVCMSTSLSGFTLFFGVSVAAVAVKNFPVCTLALSSDHLRMIKLISDDDCLWKLEFNRLLNALGSRKMCSISRNK